MKIIYEQECIPVGCVPPAHWLYSLVLCSPGLGMTRSDWGWPGLTRAGGDQVWLGDGGYLPPTRPGTYPPPPIRPCGLSHDAFDITPPPHPHWTKWVTHTCENITFATGFLYIMAQLHSWTRIWISVLCEIGGMYPSPSLCNVNIFCTVQCSHWVWNLNPSPYLCLSHIRRSMGGVSCAPVGGFLNYFIIM